MYKQILIIGLAALSKDALASKINTTVSTRSRDLLAPQQYTEFNKKFTEIIGAAESLKRKFTADLSDERYMEPQKKHYTLETQSKKSKKLSIKRFTELKTLDSELNESPELILTLGKIQANTYEQLLKISMLNAFYKQFYNDEF